MSIDAAIKSQVIERRQQESLTLKELQKAFPHISQRTIAYWIKDIPLTLSRKQAIWKTSHQILAEKARNKRRLYQNEGRITAQKKEWLHCAGCMLYWGEGSKGRNAVTITNMDVNMLKFFMSFLRHYFPQEVPNASIRIQYFSNSTKSIDDINSYWLEALQLSSKSLRKGTLKTSSSTNRHEYGICTIDLQNTWIVNHIYGAIQEYASFRTEEWLR